MSTTFDKESSLQYLLRNLRKVISFLPEHNSRHLNALNHRGLPITIKDVYGWQGFLQFVYSWQPVDENIMKNSDSQGMAFSTGLNLDPRKEADIVKEMEKVLFLSHHLCAMVTYSKVCIAWAKLDEANHRKEEWLSESSELLEALEELYTPDQWKAVQTINQKLRDLLRTIY